MQYTQEDMVKAISESYAQGRKDSLKDFIQGSLTAILFFTALALAFIMFT